MSVHVFGVLVQRCLPEGVRTRGCARARMRLPLIFLSDGYFGLIVPCACARMCLPLTFWSDGYFGLARECVCLSHWSDGYFVCRLRPWPTGTLITRAPPSSSRSPRLTNRAIEEAGVACTCFSACYLQINLNTSLMTASQIGARSMSSPPHPLNLR